MPYVAIVGAGASGLAGAKALADAGIAFDCYEKGDRVGGNWVFKNSNGQSSAYRSLHINTSKARSEFSDFRMPADYPDYAHHSQIAAYLEAYATRFELHRRIRLQTPVERVESLGSNGFRILLGTGEERDYDALVVANGHHWDPQWPEPKVPGRFDGDAFHAHDYVDPAEPCSLTGKRVVVVGMGNSAMDIACELSHTAARVFLVARRGAYVLPKYLFGKPIDQASGRFGWLPRALRWRLAKLLYSRIVGDLRNFGLPKPAHELWQAHPTLSSELLPRLKAGAIRPKPALTELLGTSVRFEDGSVEPADAIIYCTGYRMSFPFFDPAFIQAKSNDLPLFRRVFHPAHPNLFFLGLAQPVGAIFPIVEAQAKWIAEYLTGGYALPDARAMKADMERERERVRRRYVSSPRHTMQIDFDEYLAALAKELGRGRSRARRGGLRLPIAARASGDLARSRTGSA